MRPIYSNLGYWISILLMAGVLVVAMVFLKTGRVFGQDAFGPQPASLQVCVNEPDIMELVRLLGDKKLSKAWTKKVKAGRCATLKLPFIYYRTVDTFGPIYIVEFLVAGYPEAHLFGVLTQLPPNVFNITYQPEYDKASDAIKEWFHNAETTPEAYTFLGYSKCCEHSERFKTKFTVSKENGKEEWRYLGADGTWKIIPSYVIHSEGIVPPKGHEDDPDFKQLETEGVLFIYPAVSGRPTCFWPPETGG